ncbi:MAG: pseudouridine synthase [Desulfomonilaceae bacterium]|nr:pseudouridine synthase [Desulfomonilaceae bacterium]
MPLKRIHLILRDAGLGSRRHAEEMIRDGRITVNGETIDQPGAMADPEKDHIKVDGKLLRLRDTEKFYYAFNKPRNVVSTMSDPEGRPCVGDLIKAIKKQLFPVGRLDFDAEGLMILTNDGQLSEKLSHPRNKIPRTYMVKVRGRPDEKLLSTIRRGMSLGEGDRLGEVQWTVIKQQKSTTWIKLLLYEGKKNEIKRIFFRLRHPVRKIRRIRFGPIALGKLPVGAWRQLTETEMSKLKALMGKKSS